MEPKDVVTELWARIAARDWAAVGALVAPDAVVDWPVTGERIAGRDNFVAVQREYPEGWSIRVHDVVAEGERVISHVDVPHTEFGLSQAVSVWTVRDGLIVAGREYWTSPRTETPPEWRRRYTEPLDG